MEEQKIIPIEDLGIELSLDDVDELLALFNTPGWRVLQKEIWEKEKEESINVGMSLTVDDKQRVMHRGVYHKILDLECLEGYIRHARDVAMGMVKSED